MKTETVTTWHVFSDGIDDWFGTFEEAKKAYDELCKEYANVRLYEEKSQKDVDDIVEETHVMGQGEFPY